MEVLKMVGNFLGVLSTAPSVTETFETAINGVKTQSTSMINSALPVALGIAGLILAVGIGWKMFKKFTK